MPTTASTKSLSAPLGQMVSLIRGFAAAKNPGAFVRARTTVTDRTFEKAGSVGIALPGVLGNGSQLDFAPSAVHDGEVGLDIVPPLQLKITLGELTEVFGESKRMAPMPARVWRYVLPGPPAAPGHLSRLLITLDGDPKLAGTRVQRIVVTYERR